MLAKAKKEETRSAESAFKAIDDLLRGSGGGCSGSLEYMEQSSWLLFLRYLDSLQYRIGSIFSELTCRFTSGYTLREVIDLIQPLKFQTDEETPQKH